MDIDSVTSEQAFAASKYSPLPEHCHFVQNIDYLMIYPSQQRSLPLGLIWTAICIWPFKIMLWRNKEAHVQATKLILAFNRQPMLGS